MFGRYHEDSVQFEPMASCRRYDSATSDSRHVLRRLPWALAPGSGATIDFPFRRTSRADAADERGNTPSWAARHAFERTWRAGDRRVGLTGTADQDRDLPGPSGTTSVHRWRAWRRELERPILMACFEVPEAPPRFAPCLRRASAANVQGCERHRERERSQVDMEDWSLTTIVSRCLHKSRRFATSPSFQSARYGSPRLDWHTR
jgi:hypothetical protein